MKKIIGFALIAVLASAATLGIYEYLGLGTKEVIIERESSSPIKYVDNAPVLGAGAVDFTEAAEKTTSAVVHIISTKVSTMQTYDPWRELFGDDFFRGQPMPKNQRERRSQSSGSGVIISEDGYIVTNNHVVAGADEIEVTLWNKERVQASVVGTDPSTDLALLKIQENDLPIVPFANSDQVRVGEWVLAVGNPFNLESTVTAGIVSAKGRNINILKDQYSIESFIQTDAAVNPGNSGGALVDLNGNLIGINTAIATPTGVYAGYSFAVPANIVSKVCEDLKKYGIVQRGFLGVMIRNVDGNLAKELELDVTSGVYVDRLVEDGAADLSGLEEGDVIVKVDGKEVSAVPELQERIGSKRPGDKVEVQVNRDGKLKTVDVVLRNKDGETKIIEKEEISPLANLGIEVEDLSEDELEKLGLKGGAKVSAVKDGFLRRNTRIREGFVITEIDDRPIADSEEVEKYLKEKKSGTGMIEGFYPGIRGKIYYGYGLE